MGIEQGSMTLTRYHAEFGDGGMQDEVSRYSFREIDDSRGERESFGWVDPEDPEDVCHSAGAYYIGEGWHHLTARRDTKKIDRRALKARIARKTADTMTMLGVERPSRQQRLAIREETELAMLAEVTARTGYVDALFNEDSGHLLVGATGAMADRFRELFAATFGATSVTRITAEVVNGSDTPVAAPFLHRLAGGASVDFGTVTFVAGDKIVLAHETAKAALSGDATEPDAPGLKELVGSVPVARIRVIAKQGEEEWTLDLSPDWTIRGLKLPVPKTGDAGEDIRNRAKSAFFICSALDAATAAGRGAMADA